MKRTVLASVPLLWLLACSSTSGESTTPTSSATSSHSGGGGSAPHDGGAGQAGGLGGSGALGRSGGSAGTGGTGVGGTDTGGSAPSCPAPGVPDCSPGSGDGQSCFFLQSCFSDRVAGSVNYVVTTQHPEWIDWSDGHPRVLAGSEGDFVLAVVARIQTQQLCSIPDPNAGDEVVVKFDNEFAENFDILSSEGYARWGPGIYTSTCIPAWF